MSLKLGLSLTSQHRVGGGIANPTEISGLTHWFDANNEANGVLATFTNRVGAPHATTVSASATIVAGASPNGLRKVLRFAGAQNYQVATTLVRPYTMIMAYKPVTGNTGRTIGGNGATFILGAFAGSAKEIYCGNNVYGPTGALDNFCRLGLVAEVAVSKAYDAGVFANQTADLGNPGIAFQIGTDNAAFFYTGDISELLVYNRALTASEILDIDNYFVAKHVV